jgi:glycosyltransferase involved in cell wall biosynthesis
MKPTVSVVIHTHNEEANIKECIESAKLLTDTILVVDMESTDKTVSIAKELKVAVEKHPFSHYVEPARAFGIARALSDWVFILDADERITKELAEEIKQITNDNKISPNDVPAFTYYKVPRKNIFGKKKWLQHGGWSPDHQMRFINKNYFQSWPKEIHSTPKIDGQMGYLKNPILHYFHGDLEKMVEKTTVFEDIESDLLYKANRPVQTSTFFRKFVGEFYRRLIKNGGFWDGPIGIIESIYQAYSKTITYLYLYEKKNSRTV